MKVYFGVEELFFGFCIINGVLSVGIYVLDDIEFRNIENIMNKLHPCQRILNLLLIFIFVFTPSL